MMTKFADGRVRTTPSRNDLRMLITAYECSQLLETEDSIWNIVNRLREWMFKTNPTSVIIATQFRDFWRTIYKIMMK